MSRPCDRLTDFAAGELPADQAEEMRAHLRTCAACQRELIETMTLDAQLSTLGEPRHSE